jgi:hypothetical protein
MGDDESSSKDGTERVKACSHCFTDDFSRARPGWPTEDSSGREINRAGGKYAVTLTEAGSFTFFGPDLFDANDLRLDFADSTVSVAARATAGTPAMGLVCRWNDGGGASARAYAFSVLEDSYAVRGAAGRSLARGDLPQGTDLSKPTKLEATCAGDRLTFSVDGTQVARVEDSTLASGSDGLLVATNPDGTVPATAEYDDYEQR